MPVNANANIQDDVLAAIVAERTRQDAEWGGPAHDDMREAVDWADMIKWQLGEMNRARGEEKERRLIQVAALAVAAVEALRRQRAAREAAAGAPPAAPKPTEGWVRVSDWKWHYMAPRQAHASEWRSLCGRYGTLVKPNFDSEEGLDDSPDNCRACVAKLASRRAKAQAKQEAT